MLNLLLEVKIFGSKYEWIDFSDSIELMIRFILNFIVIFTIVRLLYYPLNKRKDYLFTFFLFNLIVFFICALLNNIKLEMGFAFGLFAVFGILRYRTEQLPIKEMTYLFMVIAIAIINSLSNKTVSLTEVLFSNFAMIVATFYLEKLWLVNRETKKSIVYENINLIKPDKYDELLADLRERTGLDIKMAVVKNIDFLRDTANVDIYYTPIEDMHTHKLEKRN